MVLAVVVGGSSNGHVKAETPSRATLCVQRLYEDRVSAVLLNNGRGHVARQTRDAARGVRT
jgi:hypothetical protein